MGMAFSKTFSPPPTSFVPSWTRHHSSSRCDLELVIGTRDQLSGLGSTASFIYFRFSAGCPRPEFGEWTVDGGRTGDGGGPIVPSVRPPSCIYDRTLVSAIALLFVHRDINRLASRNFVCRPLELAGRLLILPGIMLALLVLLMLQQPTPTQSIPDATYPNLIPRTIAFGSCHSRKLFDLSPSSTNIWDTISSHKPDAFLWAGDAVYPPNKLGNAPLDILRYEYNQMLTNDTVGYSRTMLTGSPTAPPGGVHGTYDDHDYGGNDRGKEMIDRIERRDAYLDFLGIDSNNPRRNRNGLYSSISFGTASRKVLTIFLDTRWGRDRHCIPSVAAAIPLGAVLSCVTRWISAGLNLPAIFASCRNRKMLNDEQWTWLEDELSNSDAQIHILVSSVQILTTNPVVESWGHFPEERERLLRLINGLPGLILISGDVHHADISDALAGIEGMEEGIPGQQQLQRSHGIIEITSSGLTHSCIEPFYGALCAPILRMFPTNRFSGMVIPGKENLGDDASTAPDGEFFFTGRNYGTIDIDWAEKSNGIDDPNIGKMKVNVHNDVGRIVLSTGAIKLIGGNGIHQRRLTDDEISRVKGCVDGHLRPLAKMLALAAVMFCFCWTVWRRRWVFNCEAGAKKEKVG